MSANREGLRSLIAGVGFATVSGSLLAAAAVVTPAAAQGISDAYDEIIVTARKREESLQDVPISGTALSADQLDLFQIEEFDDFVRAIPGANILGNGPEFLRDVAFRGLGSGRSSDSNSATGIYKNGVFSAGGTFGGRSFTILDLYDVERIEAFRGPQGALFGRNAYGGAINIVTARPRFETEARLGVTYDSEVTRRIDGVAKAPIIEDRLALRLAALYSDAEGHLTNEFTNSDTHAERLYTGGRASLLFNATERLSALVVAEYLDSQVPGFSAALTKPRPFRPSFFGLNNNTPSITENEEWSVSLEIGYELDWASLTWITQYKARDTSTLDDLDGFRDNDGVTGMLPAYSGLATQERFGDFERVITEARLSGEAGPRLRWLLGADFLADSETFLQDQEDTAPGMALLATIDREKDVSSYSVFGSLDHDLTERWTVGAEVRWLVENRQSTTFSSVMGGMVTGLTGEDETSEILPVLTATYRFESNDRLYGRIARGLRTGGFNDRSSTVFTYEDEKVWSYELGAKTNWFGGRVQVDGAIFYTQIEDAQATAPVVVGGIVQPGVIVQNLGDAESYGGEIEARTRFTLGPGSLTVLGGISTQEGQFTDDRIVALSDVGGGTTIGNIQDLDLPQQRDFTLNLAFTYSLPVFNTGTDLRSSVNFSHALGGREEAQFTSEELDTLTQLDARMELKAEQWSLAVFGRNLTDQRAIMEHTGGNNVLVQEPLTYGGSAELRFCRRSGAGGASRSGPAGRAVLSSSKSTLERSGTVRLGGQAPASQARA
ncbi:MAG: TonB-dependent receptor [Alphaproteobacteria bacterium]|nr:TonB-dependent receptor [Alphaproteobacteria bacterium]